MAQPEPCFEPYLTVTEDHTWEARIVETQNTPRFTLYKIKLNVRGAKWTILRRYSQFRKFYSSLPGTVFPAFPPKVALGKMDSEVIKLREQRLNEFLKVVFDDTALRMHPATLAFIKPVRHPSQLDTGVAVTFRSVQLEAENVIDPFEPGDELVPWVLHDKQTKLGTLSRKSSNGTSASESHSDDEMSDEEEEEAMTAEELQQLRATVRHLTEKTEAGHKLTVHEQNLLEVSKAKLRKYFH